MKHPKGLTIFSSTTICSMTVDGGGEDPNKEQQTGGRRKLNLKFLKEIETKNVV